VSTTRKKNTTWNPHRAQKLRALLLDPSNRATLLAALCAFKEEYEECSGEEIFNEWEHEFTMGERLIQPLSTPDIDSLIAELRVLLR
jgi:hypothetical protein